LLRSDYKMYLQDKIFYLGRGGGVGIILRDGLYVLFPLFSCLTLECEDTLEDFGFLSCFSYLCV